MDSKLERVIFADPESNNWNFACSVYKNILEIEKQEGCLNFKMGEVRFSRFPDGECEPKMSCDSRGRHVVFIHDASKNPYQWWVELMLVNDGLRRGSAEKITDVLPYMRWCREEKKDKPRIPIASKVMADTINLACLGSRADRIITMDLHASAMQGFFNIPVDVLESYDTVCEQIKQLTAIENVVVVSPDVGSADRARAFANRLGGGLDIAIIDKKRQDGNLVKVYKVVGEVAGKNCFMVDDILSSGGTLNAGREALLEAGALDIWGYVTHNVGSGDYHKNLKYFKEFYTTDTFDHPDADKKGIKIISLASIFAKAIYRAEKGQSISELFGRKR